MNTSGELLANGPIRRLISSIFFWYSIINSCFATCSKHAVLLIRWCDMSIHLSVLVIKFRPGLISYCVKIYYCSDERTSSDSQWPLYSYTEFYVWGTLICQSRATSWHRTIGLVFHRPTDMIQSIIFVLYGGWNGNQSSTGKSNGSMCECQVF